MLNLQLNTVASLKRELIKSTEKSSSKEFINIVMTALKKLKMIKVSIFCRISVKKQKRGKKGHVILEFCTMRTYQTAQT